MDILENRSAWSAGFAGWLERNRATGAMDWKRYAYARNQEAVAGPAVELGRSRLLLVTSSGAFVRGEQEPFAAADPLGDPSYRTFSVDVAPERLAFAHDHYDHAFVDRDVQSAVPLRHLSAMVEEGAVGTLVPTVFSFSGYLPDVGRVVDDLAPPLLDLARREGADAALLVPV
jgi:hypothetical protein